MSLAPCTLSDDDLIVAIASLAGVERSATASLIAHLAELETRNLHLAQGFRSLFGYCRVVLHCSEHEAYNRMEAVHAARRFPVILALLAEGFLHLTAVRLLAPHLKDEDHLALLGGAIHKSKREVVRLLARWFPSEDVPAKISKLPTSATAPTALTPAPTPPKPHAETGEERPSDGPERSAVASASVEAMSAPCPMPAAHRPIVAPLAPERYRLQVTIDEAAHDDLRCLQDLMRREIPDGDPAAIVARALRLLRQEMEKRAFAATTQPKPARALKPGSRHVPAHVERTVWRRDGGQCAFVAGSGRRCMERSFLEFHHVQPYAHAGPATVENISLRCRAHNAYESELVFGPYKGREATAPAP